MAGTAGTDEAAEHPADRDAYAVFAGAMGWAAVRAAEKSARAEHLPRRAGTRPVADILAQVRPGH